MFCLICKKEMAVDSKYHMRSPVTVEEVRQQLRPKEWMELKPGEDRAQPIRRGKSAMARRDGPKLF